MNSNLSQSQFHGTNAVLRPGDRIRPGGEVGRSNYPISDPSKVYTTDREMSAWRYATFASEVDQSRPRVYEVDIPDDADYLAGRGEFTSSHAIVRGERPFPEDMRDWAPWVKD